MSVSAISTTPTYPQGTSRGGALKSLVDGINNGDLTSAKAAFDTLQKNRQGAPADAAGATSQRDQDFAAIGKALDSGDADAAKQALAKLRDDRKDASGAAPATHHQHHHGHRTQSAEGAPLTYSPSAAPAPAAAPGATIDVSA
jgi:hypothetical protein